MINLVSKSRTKRGIYFTACLIGTGTMSLNASAQNVAQPDELKAIYACKTKSDPNERLACFDAAIGNFETAEKSGNIVTFDAKSNEKEKRGLFGKKKKKDKVVTRNKIDGNDVFGDNLKKVSLEISRTKEFGRQKIRFYLANGQVWEQTQDEIIRVPKVKDGKPNVANIRKASFGSFMLNVNGKGKAVRVKRVK